MTSEQRPIFLVRLRPEPHVTDTVRALRALLKLALRRFGPALHRRARRGRAVMSLAQIPRLRQLLLMLSSDQPGEVAAAAAAIGRALKASRHRLAQPGEWVARRGTAARHQASTK